MKHQNVNIGKPEEKTYPKILCGIRVGLMPVGMVRFRRSIFPCRGRKQQVKRQMNPSLNDKAFNILIQVLSYTCPREANNDCQLCRVYPSVCKKQLCLTGRIFMQVDNENFEEKFWLQSMYMNRYEYL
jgi:hypothetical protein